MTNRHLTHQFEQAQKSKAAAAAANANAADNKPSKGTVGQLVYTKPNDKALPTMVLLVDAPAYETYKKDAESMTVANVVDSYQVLKYEHGKSGIMNKPSKSELDAVFGTTKGDAIVDFMLQHGALHIKAM